MRRNAWWMVLQVAIVVTVAFFVGRTEGARYVRDAGQDNQVRGVE